MPGFFIALNAILFLSNGLAAAKKKAPLGRLIEP
jgi:hypothetical protein